MASATTKHDMVKRVAAETDTPRNVVRQIVQAFLDDIIDELAHGKRLEFREFGVFDVVNRKPRVARNPRTGDPIHVPAKTVAHFKQGRAMRTRVAEYGEALGRGGEGRPSHQAGAAGGKNPGGDAAERAGSLGAPGGQPDASGPPSPARPPPPGSCR